MAQVETALTTLLANAAPAELEGRDPAGVLEDPALTPEEKLFQFCAALARKQEETVEAMAQAWQARMETQRASLGAAGTEHPGALQGLQQDLEGAHETAVLEAAGLQGTVVAAREAVGGQIDRLAAELTTQGRQSARDVDELKKDLVQLEDAFLARVDRAREIVRTDAERFAEETRHRVHDVEQALTEAVQDLARALEQMGDAVRQATSEAADARRDMVPLFDDLDSRIHPMKNAVESIRSAAHSVGIPF